jgi:hypothetical protein
LIRLRVDQHDVIRPRLSGQSSPLFPILDQPDQLFGVDDVEFRVLGNQASPLRLLGCDAKRSCLPSRVPGGDTGSLPYPALGLVEPVVVCLVHILDVVVGILGADERVRDPRRLTPLANLVRPGCTGDAQRGDYQGSAPPSVPQEIGQECQGHNCFAESNVSEECAIWVLLEELDRLRLERVQVIPATDHVVVEQAEPAFKAVVIQH